MPHHVLRNSVQLCAALALIASAPVQAQILPAAGRIVSVRPPGSAKIAGRPGPPKIAHYADLLQPGDRIVFAGPGTVLARVYGRDVEFKAGDQELVVPSRDVGRYSERDEDFFRGVQRFLEQPRRSIASYSYVRTPGEEGAGPPPVADPLSPVGVQYVPPNARQVGLVWRDNAASLTVRAAGQARGLDSGEGSWIVIPVPAGARAWSIATGRGDLHWEIEVVAETDAPPWLDKAAPLSEAERVTRAVWLIEKGPPSWRLFALGELSDLAGSGNFVADELWRAARSGEWREIMDARGGRP